MEQLSFSPGQIIGIECYHFRGINHARVYTLPTVNYFVAPNGFGKTTLLYAVALCLGSQHQDLKDTDSLIQENQLWSCVLVSICNTDQLSLSAAHSLFTTLTSAFSHKTHSYVLKKLEHESICTIHVLLKRGKDIQLYINGKSISQDKLRKEIRKRFEIQIDNPFQSMMQSDAQRLTLMTPSERLIKFLDLIFPNITSTLEILQPKTASLMKFCHTVDDIFTTFHERNCDRFLKVMHDLIKLIELGSLQKIVGLANQALLVLEFLEINTSRNSALSEYKKLVNDMKSKEKPFIALKADIEKNKIELQKVMEEMDSKSTALKSSMLMLEKESRAISANSRRLIDLRVAYEAIITQKANQSDEDRLAVQQRINFLNDTINDHEKSINEIEAKRSEASVALCNIGSEESSLYQSAEYKSIMAKNQQIDAERNDREQMVIQCRNLPYYSWLVDIYKVSLELELDASMRHFLFAPAGSWIGIKSDTPIPFNIVKFMLQSALGQSLYSILTNSIEHQSNLSKKFGQYKDRNGATSIELLQNYRSMNYQDACSHAEQELRKQYASLKARTINTADINFFSSASSIQVSTLANIVFLIDCLDGNPIVLNHFFYKLSVAIYVQSSSGSMLTASEIIKFMEANVGIFNILCHDNMLHVGTTNNKKQLVARTSYGHDPNMRYAECVKNYTEKMKYPRFMYKILEDKKAAEKERKELEDSYSDSIQASKARTEELKLFINQSSVKLTELNQSLREYRLELNTLHAKLKTYKVITEQDILTAEKSYIDTSNLLSASTISILAQSKAGLNEIQFLVPLIMQAKDIHKTDAELNFDLTAAQNEYQLAQKRVTIFQENTLTKIEDEFKVRKGRIMSILKALCPIMVPDTPPDDLCDSSSLEATLPCLLYHREFNRDLTAHAASVDCNSKMDFFNPSTIDLSSFRTFVSSLERRLQLQQSKQDQSAKQTFSTEKKKFCDFLSDQFASNTYVTIHLFHLLEVVRTVQENVAEVIAEVSKRFRDNINEFGISGEAVLTGLFISERRNSSSVSSEFDAAYTLLKKYNEDYQCYFDVDKIISFLAQNASLKAVSTSSFNKNPETDPYTTLVLGQQNIKSKNKSKNKRKGRNHNNEPESSTTISEDSSTDSEPLEPRSKRAANHIHQGTNEDCSALISRLAPFFEKLKQVINVEPSTLDESSSDEQPGDSHTEHSQTSTRATRTGNRSVKAAPIVFSLDTFNEMYQKNKKISSARAALSDFLENEIYDYQLIALSKAFKPIVKEPQIQAIIPLMNALKPGLELRTQFVANETLTGITLSGGESSVVALCLVNSLYGQKALSAIRFRLVDEINQGLDDKFEEAAHNILCSIRSDRIQYFIGSPKLPSYLKFKDPRIRVHIILRRPILGEHVNLLAATNGSDYNGDTALEDLCTEEFYS